MMSTEPNRLERRGGQRFEVHQPVSIHLDGRTVHGFTQDLSSRGMFFYAQTALPEGTVLELTFIMPSEISLGDNMPVRCRGRVLRSSTSPDGQKSGIAVQLDAYEYLPADEPVTQFVRVSTAGNIASVSGSVSR